MPPKQQADPAIALRPRVGLVARVLAEMKHKAEKAERN